MKRVSALVLVFAAAACAGEPTVNDVATLEGVVTDSAGTALAGARVSTTPPTETVMTDATGKWAIALNVRRGQTYEVTAEAQGFIEKTSTIFTEVGVNSIDFVLEAVILCMQGEARCANGQIERCMGTSWMPGTCPNGQVCDNSAGPRAAACVVAERLTVTSNGSGGGLVASSPGGISCSPSCSFDFAHNQEVTLNATPFALSAFTGFSGACTSSTAQCTVVMDGPKTVTATFETSGYLLNVRRTGAGRVRSTPMGINCGGTCRFGFADGTEVTLMATPDAGSAFGGWGGACASAGMNPACTVTMNSDLTVDVLFQTPQFSLNVTTGGTGAGTISSEPEGIDCGPDCDQDYDINTLVSLTAVPMAGSTFIGWGGDCTGTGDCMVTMDQDHNVSATFDGIAHTVTVMRVGAGTGRIQSTPSGIDCGATCNATFGDGQMIQLQASGLNGSIFGGWTDACATAMTNPTCMITVGADLTATGRFDPFFFGPLAADASCTLLVRFDNPNPFDQLCMGGAPAALVGTYGVIMSRTTLLGQAPNAGGANEEGHIELSKLGPAPGVATIEMTVRKNGPAYDARAIGTLFSNEDSLHALTSGVRLFVRDDGRFGAETRSGTGSSSLVETAANAITDGTWYHLAATLNSTTGIQLFVDGAQVANLPGPLAWTASSSTAWAGAEREGGAGSINRFNGAIDEIRVSDVLRY